MSFSLCSWFKNIIYSCCCCCKSKPILDLKNDHYNTMDDNDVTVTFNSVSPKNGDENKRYSLSDEITYNEIYR